MDLFLVVTLLQHEHSVYLRFNDAEHLKKKIPNIRQNIYLEIFRSRKFP